MNIGFKEWALVCEAMGGGEQSIFVRKGGIAEGRDGFRFKHDEFYLLPTHFHEQLAKTKLPPETPLPAHEEGVIEVRYFARVEWTRLVADLEKVKALAPFHIIAAAVVEERFHYGETPGVNVAFARIYRLDEPWTFPDEAKYGGCRSWVALLESPANVQLAPVLDDAAHARRAAEVLALID